MTVLFLAGSAIAQQPAPVVRVPVPQTETLHVESRLVSVALNVVDEHGAPVAGLKAGDFELTEDARPQRIAVFDAESATPLQIVLALDASESVFIDERLEKDAAKSFVKSLIRPQDRLDLMDFADNVDELVAFTNDTKKIDAGLGRIIHGDATALYDAVYLAGQRLAEAQAAPGARKVIVLITDGENTTRHGSYDAALEQAERAGAMVYSLIVVPIAADAGRNTGGEHALIQMAQDTGGKYYYVEDKKDLGPAFAHVSDDLRTQYTVGYYAPERGVEMSGLRQIRLQLKDPELRKRYVLRYRTAYYGKR
jgi:Ca-activated chloride channel family protein